MKSPPFILIYTTGGNSFKEINTFINLYLIRSESKYIYNITK